MRALSVAAVCVATLCASPSAAVESYLDPDDTPRRLDIARLEHRVAGKGERARLVHVVQMHRRWPKRLFRVARRGSDRGTSRGWLSLSLNTRGDRRSDWGVTVHRDSGGWFGELCSHVRKDPGGRMHYDPICYKAKVWKPNPRSIAIAVMRTHIVDRDDPSYGWRAYTRLAVTDGCPDGSGPECEDWAPGRPSYLRHSFGS